MTRRQMDACYLIYSTQRLSTQNCIISVLAYLTASTYQNLCYWCQSLAQGCECDQLYPEICVPAVAIMGLEKFIILTKYMCIVIVDIGQTYSHVPVVKLDTFCLICGVT